MEKNPLGVLLPPRMRGFYGKFERTKRSRFVRSSLPEEVMRCFAETPAPEPFPCLSRVSSGRSGQRPGSARRFSSAAPAAATTVEIIR